MTTPNYMAQLGATLVDRGFRSTVQPRSKKPGMYHRRLATIPKWNRHASAPPREQRSTSGAAGESDISIAAGG